MVKSTGAPASEAPIPDAPRTAAAPEAASPVSDIEASFGASPADAEAGMRQTFAMREAAMDAADGELGHAGHRAVGPARTAVRASIGQLSALGRESVAILCRQPSDANYPAFNPTSMALVFGIVAVALVSSFSPGAAGAEVA